MSQLTKLSAEKYMKRLIGRSDVEDALKRLDKLTDEEARMATAQVLRVTHAVAEDVGQVKRSSLFTSSVLTAVSHVFAGKQLWGDLHKWLSPPDPSTNHNIACSTHQKRTASWFFQGSIFAGWKSTNSLLWIHGKRASYITGVLPAWSPLTTYCVRSRVWQEYSLVRRRSSTISPIKY
jgi:hypothetical protein